jgi:threonine synthase
MCEIRHYEATMWEMNSVESRQICAGCGWVAPVDAEVRFSCPQAAEAAQDDVDHLLHRNLKRSTMGEASAAKMIFADFESNPFIKYRELLHSYHTGRAHGLSDGDYCRLVSDLAEELRQVDGREFRATPFLAEDRLAKAVGLTSRNSLWIKNETGNVAGSHKVRHLLGILTWLKIKEALAQDRTPGSDSDQATLAISSCGNAALAAATVAAAAGRSIEVFIPTWADPSVVRRLEQLKAKLTVCPRTPDVDGDPCHRAFRTAVARGAIPFSCQGPDNGLNIEGGETLAWEMIADLARAGQDLDHLIIQVGGGALASASIHAFTEANELGVIEKLPRFHTIQARSVAPLERAYMKVLAGILNRWRKVSNTDCGLPASTERLARFVKEQVDEGVIEAELAYAANHRSEYMWPWGEEPQSIASGILDDETYDWHVIVGGMLKTGGIPVLASEDALENANRAAKAYTGIPVDPTGSAGVAGLVQLRSEGIVDPSDSVGLLFTGIDRSIGAF